jgi:hypothetical protein
MNFFSIYLILQAALVPEVYSASNRNEYQKQKNISEKLSAAGAYDSFTAMYEVICTMWDP